MSNKVVFAHGLCVVTRVAGMKIPESSQQRTCAPLTYNFSINVKLPTQQLLSKEQNQLQYHLTQVACIQCLFCRQSMHQENRGNFVSKEHPSFVIHDQIPTPRKLLHYVLHRRKFFLLQTHRNLNSDFSDLLLYTLCSSRSLELFAIWFVHQECVVLTSLGES